MEYEEIFVLNEFSEIIKQHNSALDKLKRFQEGYPYLIAPNIFDTLQHNLKENTQILFREMSGLHNQKDKKYDKKYVCKVCHQVYMMKLRGGICDECRGKYGDKVYQMVDDKNKDSETDTQPDEESS